MIIQTNTTCQEKQYLLVWYTIMEVVRLGDKSIKIRSKNATIVVDPSTKTDADVIVIMTSGIDISFVQTAKLIIQGAGEYEVMGVAIKSEQQGNGLWISVMDDPYKILICLSTNVGKATEEEGYDALVVKATDLVQKDLLASFAQKVCIVFGSSEFLPTGDVKIFSKVNIKKLEEVAGSIVVLGKE